MIRLQILYLITNMYPTFCCSIGASISRATTLCRRGSHGRRGRLQNDFRCCATLLILLRFNNLIEFYCPPTQNFRENFLLEKQASLCDKLILSFGFMVEGLPQYSLWDIIQRHSSNFGRKLIYLQTKI